MKTKLLGSWLLGLLFLGCQAASTTTDDVRDDQAASKSLSQPNVVIASWEETEQFIAQQRGKVVVLDVWSSWCIPCIQEFPHLVELHNKYPDQVACVSLNVDYAGLPDETPESYQEDVLEFLTQQGATFHNVISSQPDTEIYETLELSSVPAVYVFDRQGNLRQRFDSESTGPFTYDEDIFPLVEQLIQDPYLD